MTITSGLVQVGKTHLAINLALELVRRGHFAGVFHDPGQRSAVDELLDLSRSAGSPRRADDNEACGIMRRGYQGLDVLSCEIPVGEWTDLDADQRARCTGNLDVPEGYDDFLIDTSGMDAHALLACCKAAAVVILLVTPEPRSQAESFALLRVLQLNGFSGELYLVINKSSYPVDSQDIYNDFSRLVKDRLGLDITFLGAVPEDRRVETAQQHRQAFSSLCPDSASARAVYAMVDALQAVPADIVAGPQTLPAFLDALLDVMQAPVSLPGGAVLEELSGAVLQADKPLPEAGEGDGFPNS
jgi:flagellar biosynthesis protein FlhG